ncbi:MAG: type IV pilus twitching motility protein PilT [Firmicutes bacterium]|nr:type IV pilus twitching motility protein PilT [Bacillota bacterium]
MEQGGTVSVTSLLALLREAFRCRASDLHLTAGMPPMFRIDGCLVSTSLAQLTSQEIAALAQEIMTEALWEQYLNQGELDFPYSVPGEGRLRVNAFRQRGGHALAIRLIAKAPPTLEELDMPSIVRELALGTQGLVLVTGPSGSGKSTTLAGMINEINYTCSSHIITLEEPIEFVHSPNKSIIHQREVGRDTKTYASGLRAALRADPDVILIGEMRDLETISVAITAAETGHLVLSTLHTKGAARSIDRIVDVFPPHQQNQIQLQLSNVLAAIISQELLPRQDGKGRVAAQEIMIATPAIRNLIREGKTHQIDSMIQIGGGYGMITMDQALANLYQQGVITHEQAVAHSNVPQSISG